MKNEREYNFGRNVIICLVTALSICAAVEFTCLALGIAPLFTPNLPINEKMRFLRDHRFGPTPIAVVSGASIALNDIDTDLLEDQEDHPFVNLGANGVSVPTSEKFYNQLANLHPVREVIFAASPVELRDAHRSDVEVPTPVFRRYVQGRMTMAEEFTYRDISGLMSYWKYWHDYHSRTSPTSMVFTKTGAVPLEIDPGPAESRSGIGEAMDLSSHCTSCMGDMADFCRDVRSAGLPFTVVLGPVRPDVLEQSAKVRDVVADRKAQVRAIVHACKAQVFDITDYATVDSSCFANSLHLNAQGMSAMTAQFEHFRRGESIPKGTVLSCGRSVRLATSSGTHQQVGLGAPASSE